MQILSGGKNIEFNAIFNNHVYSDPSLLLHEMFVKFLAKHKSTYEMVVNAVW